MSIIDTRGVANEDVIDLDRTATRAIRQRSFRLLGTILRPRRAQVIWLTVVVVLAQAARAAGPAIIAVAINTALPALERGDSTLVIWWGAALFAVAISGGSLTWYSIRLTSIVSQSALLDLRRRVFRHVQRLSLEFHERYTSGRAIARQTSDLDAIRELLDSGINQLLSNFIYMAMVAVLIVMLDPITALVFAFSLIPVWFVTRWFTRESQRQYRSSRVASSNLIVQFVETITGVRAVQAFRREQAATDEHRAVSDAYRDAEIRAMSLNGIYDPTLVWIGNLTTAALLAIDGYRMLSGDLPVGTLIAAVLYAKRFFQPLEQMARFYNALQAAVASLEKISGLLEERPDLAEPRQPASLPSARGEIALAGVSFSYITGRKVLHETDLLIPAGQTVALVGATGAGKSTIAKLIARFYDVTEGAVQLDGIDVRSLAFSDLRRHIVVVTQENYLFSGSIADNIGLGKPDATRDQVVAAARAVGAHEFIERLPDGYDTDVNKRGGRLSAGQRQLVSFARAFIADPTVLILDEATSSLDLPSELIVQRALATLLRGRTAVIIAHRLSTVDIADRVLVLRDGRILEDGSPDELRRTGGEFAQMSQRWDEAEPQDVL